MTLHNGGFEGDWTRSTDTGVEFGEIFVPEGWVAFWREGNGENIDFVMCFQENQNDFIRSEV